MSSGMKEIATELELDYVGHVTSNDAPADTSSKQFPPSRLRTIRILATIASVHLPSSCVGFAKLTFW